MMRCSDDWLKGIRLWCDYGITLYALEPICFIPKEKNMRFEIEKVENESINLIYGEVYCVKDNQDSKSPVNDFRMLKPSAERVCKWLNENIKEVELSPVDKLENALKELYEPDEVQLNYHEGLFFIVEIKDTDVTAQLIANKLGIDRSAIMIETMRDYRAIYKIWESCLKDE